MLFIFNKTFIFVEKTESLLYTSLISKEYEYCFNLCDHYPLNRILV